MRVTLTTMVVFVLAMIIAPCAWSDERRVDLNYDEVWVKLLQVLAIEGASVTSKDKETGIIQGDGSFYANSSNFSCPKVKGHVESREYQITVVVNKDDDDVVVNAVAQGTIRVVQTRRRLVVGRSSSHHEYRCISTGGFENSILNKLVE